MVLFITILVTAILMEGVAWAMHKYIMHGIFWNLHEDHHVRDNHDSFFERNDSFFVFFAIISITAFLLWSIFDWQISLGIGIGVFVYGVVYFIIHDLFIHQRIKIWRKTKNPYLLGIRRAHKMHHKHLGKHDGECFGMLWVPMKYYKGNY
ncbi:sterol desaturase family protein [Lutimonas zeaxanthinifaciens]|uniref:sterol desaturase family protein n=1 Tax=Lutimonas zeaxanthinifaciens TaxID=3060215 RepID=UPI00265CB7D0|nr:sterol desaturase family protein [Lutimonas sp. YSD2104]WKK65190.1 sterol desaturase family protein [Lutimonas sp. YSD2104]